MHAHLDGVGGEKRRHPLLPSRQRERQLWRLWLWQDPAWRGGGDKRLLGDGVFVADVVVDFDAGSVAGGVAGGVVDGEDLAVDESVLVVEEMLTMICNRY